jgi:hypothetical protein
VPIIKPSSTLSAALAADAAIAAYLRALADQRAAELTGLRASAAGGRWSTAPLTRGRFQRVVPLHEPVIERIGVSSRAEFRAAPTRQAR